VTQMSKIWKLAILIIFLLGLISCSFRNNYRKISVQEYRSKMKAGWLGQMAGVGWGATTEFKYNAEVIPKDSVPAWEPEMINQHYQDDIYVEMTFLKTLEEYGFDVSIRQAGIDFANSQYMLWHANKNGRYNLRSGIAPPYSGHPKYNSHADDIDYQIEADYSGLIAPGLPQFVINLGEKFGRLMNYGDGLYGGQFVGGMYAEAFFEKDINKIIAAGLKCIPEGSQYSEAIRDVIKWHKKYPENWLKTWQLIENKYNLNPDYRKFSCTGTDPKFNIDAKINGAYIVMGLLYGEGNMDKTIIISMRCGQDSDCNPSNAAGILATSLGMENLPDKYKTGIVDTTKFSYTAYNFPSLINVCESLSREVVAMAGGKIKKNLFGREEYLIPLQKPEVSKLVQCWEPEEINKDVHFTDSEMEKIKYKVRDVDEFVDVWRVSGPFKKEGIKVKGLLDQQFAPEVDMNYSDWEKMPVGEGGYSANEIDLDKYFGTQQCVAYLKTNIFMDNSQEAILEVGSDDGIKIWLNNQVVHQNNVIRAHEPSQEKVKVTMEKGWNTLMMKITQGVGGWAASLAITDLDGKSISDIKYK